MAGKKKVVEEKSEDKIEVKDIIVNKNTKPVSDMKLSSEKEKALELYRAKMKKDFGENSILTIDNLRDTRPATRLSTGSIQMDMIIGRGGIPFGRMTEVYGPQGCGKSTFCLCMIAEAQKFGLNALYVDMESAVDPLYTEQLGIDGRYVDIIHPRHGADALDAIETAIKGKVYDIVVIDSMALLNPPADMEKSYAEHAQVASRAGMLTRFFERVTREIYENNIMLLCINQLRANMNMANKYSPRDIIPGGYALGHAMSMIVDMRVQERITDANGEVLGQKVRVKVKKNKLSPPEKEVFIEFIYGYGIDKYKDLIDTATSIGLINKGGAWFEFEHNGEKKKVQGGDAVKDYLVKNPDFFDELKQKVIGIVGIDWDKEGK